jgi:hypothetical protein
MLLPAAARQPRQMASQEIRTFFVSAVTWERRAIFRAEPMALLFLDAKSREEAFGRRCARIPLQFRIQGAGSRSCTTGPKGQTQASNFGGLKPAASTAPCPNVVGEFTYLASQNVKTPGTGL